MTPIKVNLVLHDFSRDEPFGGIKQQYEFANRLSDLGYDVAVYHSLNFDRRVLRRPRSLLGLALYNVRGGHGIKWFELDPRVHCRYLPQVSPSLLRRAQATLISSAVVANQLPRADARMGRLFYVVYEFPVWQYGSDSLRDGLKQALRRTDIEYIASSAAVETMLADLGVHTTTKITCGIDVPDSSAIPPNADRQPVIGFALRPEPYKGALDMLKAIPLVREKHPAVRFECFGRFHDPVSLPDGLVARGYLDETELLAFYRRCAIFVSPSYAEGWGLTSAEAMANGAAVVVTDDGGSRDFATDGETALVVPSRSPEAIAAAVTTLLDDGLLRSRIATGGLRRSREMTWDRSVAQLDRLLKQSIAPARLVPSTS